MIAAFGVPTEPEPEQFSIVGMAVSDVHLTRLLPDGRGKAEVENPKIMVGPASGMPIVLASVNDTGGLAIAEGIEAALSVHQATGLGAWAAGSANRLPALAGVVPAHVSGVTVLVDDDDSGRKNSSELASRLTARGIDVDLLPARGA
jgi:Toprim domain